MSRMNKQEAKSARRAERLMRKGVSGHKQYLKVVKEVASRKQQAVNVRGIKQ